MTALALAPLTGTASATVGDVDAVESPLMGSSIPDCDTAHPADLPAAPPSQIDARLQELHSLYADLPGFVDVYYYAGEVIEYRPMFVQKVPELALTRATPVPVAFDVMPEAPVPTSAGPTPDNGDIRCFGIRPGSWVSSPIGICTLNFVYTDGTNTFIGTAGHCINEGQRAAVTVFGGLSEFQIGTAVFSTGNAGVGNDFALILVDAGWVSWVSPEMCDVAGPTGTFSGASISLQPTLQTGHGGGVPAAPPRPKPGVGNGWGATSFTWWGASIPGDSGSGIRLEDGRALGTVTHLSLLIPVQDFGTRWDRGLALAAADGWTGLSMVTVPWTHPP